MVFSESRKRGFTLVELLVVIAIIAVLGGIVLARINSSREKARIAKAQAFERNMRSKLALTEVGEWTFDNISGTNVPDSSGEGNHGTISNGATVESNDCIFRSCLEFDGINDYVDFGSDISLDPSSVTISAWVKWGGTLGGVTHKFIVGKPPNGYEFGVRDDTGILWWAHDSNFAFNETSHAFTEDKWEHVLLTFDETAGTTVYVDGKIVDTDPNIGALTSGGPVRAGHRSDDFLEYFGGTLDELRIWSSSYE